MMRIPVVRGVIDRRILVNYRVDLDVMAGVLPAPFRPKMVNGFAIGGICLIRLKSLRPRCLPLPFGVGSENAAHRMAVTWELGGVRHEGVYISRRDTNSRFNSFAGGRLFPGLHHHARFDVSETAHDFAVRMHSDDGSAAMTVRGTVTDEFPSRSVFPSLMAASSFFQAGSLGYSATRRQGIYDGLEFRCQNWHLAPLDVEEVSSGFFDDATYFPPGTAELDCALLMRGIKHEWHRCDDLCCPAI